MLDADGKKRCPKCDERKVAAGNFYRVNRTDCDGFAGYCIPCTKAGVVAWQAVMAAFDGACAYCGSTEQITIEHLTPLSRGGKNVVGNIAPACSPCNTEKNAKTVEEFAPDRAAEIRQRALLN